MDLSTILKFWEVIQVFHRYTTFQKTALILAVPVLVYAAYLVTIGRPPLVLFQTRFSMLVDKQVRPLRIGGDAFEVEFRLINLTSPPDEIHNVFGQLWMDGSLIVATTIQPSRGQPGEQRVEWDIQIPVFPKQGAFIPAKVAFRLPTSGSDITVGAQFVSKETSRDEYIWRIINNGGVPEAVSVRQPSQPE